MFNSNLNAGSDFGEENYCMGLSLVEFKEGNATIIYSPALDLSGYGYNKDEARRSFSEALSAFFRYANGKKALHETLKRLGWTVGKSGNGLKFNAPKNSDLLKTNAAYRDILNNKNYRVSKEKIKFPCPFN